MQEFLLIFMVLSADFQIDGWDFFSSQPVTPSSIGSQGRGKANNDVGQAIESIAVSHMNWNVLIWW